MNEKEIKIKSKEFWVNIIDFLQLYWALIDDHDPSDVTVYFIHEGSGVFAEMNFKSKEIAEKALKQNGFKMFDDPLENFQEYMTPPEEPFYQVNYNTGALFAS